jgi:D-alanyl-D-alanine carboxypeptidase (penicillin-binding protein 5/6)
MSMPKKISVIWFRNIQLLKTCTRTIFFIGLALFILLIPGQNVYTMSFGTLMSKPRTLSMVIAKPYPYPVNVSGIYPGEEITASGIVIRDADSGVYLYKRNEEELMSPASTTKILTAMVILDKFQLDDVMTARTMVDSGQVMGLAQGEQITVENLLYGTLIHSGNDAAYTLADNYPGGVEAFVSAMNEKAKSLGLTKSSFTNPVGYDDPGHKMTPMDLARLATAALSDKTIAKMVAIPSITISDITHTYFHTLKNVNQLLGKIPGVGGIKTGWTEEAGENLVTLVERNGHKIILVVLHSKDRFGETAQLIEWVFANYRWETYQPQL